MIEAFQVWESIMKYAVLTACLAAVALGACRREVPQDGGYIPMKLGAPAQSEAVKSDAATPRR